MPTATTTFRLKPEDLALFRQFRTELQARTPHATVTATDAFRFMCSSASAALARDDQQVTTAVPPTQPIGPEHRKDKV